MNRALQKAQAYARIKTGAGLANSFGQPVIYFKSFMPQESPLEQRLREIRSQFERSLQGRTRRVADLWDVLLTGWNDEAATSLYAEVHRLHGSCGTLGFSTVSELAGEIQSLVRDAMQNQCLPAAQIQERISALIDSLTRNCE